MKFLTAICHPDHLWRSLFWQNYRFQVFWNLKRHPANLSDWTEHFAVPPTCQAWARTEDWGDVEEVGGRPFHPRVPLCPSEPPVSPFPGCRPGRPDAAHFRVGGLWPRAWAHPFLWTPLQRGRGNSGVLLPWVLCLGPGQPGNSLGSQSSLAWALTCDAS